jgi:hypothetical protein
MFRVLILSLLVTALVMGCGGNESEETGEASAEAQTEAMTTETETTASAGDGAGAVVVEYFTLLDQGDSLAGADYFASEVMQSLGSEESFQAAQAMQRQQLQQRGGLEKIVVINEQTEGEQAMVTFEITTGGGTVDTGQALFVMREGDWKWLR